MSSLVIEHFPTFVRAYEHLLPYAKTRLRVPSPKTISLTLPKLNIVAIAEKIVSAGHPLQGSDLLFLSYILQTFRFVILNLFEHWAARPERIELGFNIYLAVITLSGALLYFARRYLSQRK